jgi:hypothetical protein
VNNESSHETAKEIALKYWISPEEVYNQLSNLKRGKASGPDNLPTWILTSCPIFNASIQGRMFQMFGN